MPENFNPAKVVALYDVLLLIAMLAEILLWCIAIAARHLGWQKDFQANSIKHRAVLSVVRLGKEVRRRPKCVPHSVKKVVDNLLGIKRIYQTGSYRWQT
jgi:hypothetical protein